MVRNTLLTALICLPIALFGQTPEPIDVSSKIGEVTVFLRGAQVQRTGKKLVKAGTHRFRFTGLSESVDPNSIQVKGQGSITILSVNHSINYLSSQDKPRNVRMMEDTLKDLRFDMSYNNQLKQVYQEERSMILANKEIGWDQAGFAVEDVEDLADFYRDRLADIMLKTMEIDTKQKKLQEQVNRINRQLNKLASRWRKNTSDIVVELAANQTTTAKLELSYFVPNAGWVPAYDLRSADVKEPIELRYNARVMQYTGVDWNNVKLTLSTGNPSQGGTKPNFSPWRLNLQYRRAYQALAATREIGRVKAEDSGISGNADGPNSYDAEDDSDNAPEPLMEEMESTTAADFTELNEGQTNLSFAIKIPYTIPADGNKHLVSVSNAGLPAKYTYSCLPKLDGDAFLVAKVSGWEQYNLLSGTANIYFEDTFIGSSWINTNTTEKELDISLGRDKGIVVTRKRIDEYSEKKVIGGNVKETVGIEIALRNTKSLAADVVLEDQIPLSTNKDITVDIEELSGATLDEKTGLLKWNLTLEPSQTSKVVIKYAVKYPKDAEINL